MKIKLTLQRSGAPAVDLMVTVDTGATVGDLAERIWRGDPLRRGSALNEGLGRPTLVIRGTADTALDPLAKVADSGLRSGAVVGLTWTPAGYAAAAGGTTAVVHQTGGPDAPREFAIAGRTGVVGRDRDCAVVLTDPLVSRRHIRFTISALPEVVDLASANGLTVNGSPVTRAVVRPDDVIGIGDTELTIRAVPEAGVGAEGVSEGHIRSPRLDPRYAGEKLRAPEPPKPATPPRFPIIAVIAPMIMGLVLYLITRSMLSLIFLAFSPLMMVGYAFETMVASKSANKKAIKQFRADLSQLVSAATAAAAEEVAARGREHPALIDCVEAVHRRGPLLWTRRPDDAGFLELRLGLGKQPSRTAIDVTERHDLPRDLMAEVAAVAEKFSTVDGVPVLARPAESGAIGFAGPRDVMLGAARSLVAQAAILHSPAELVLTAFATEARSHDWEWLKWLPHTTSPHSPLAARHLAATGETAELLASAIEELLAVRKAREAGPQPAVLVLVEDTQPVERSRLVELAEEGWQHGIHVIWLAEDTSQLPAACRTFVTLRPGSVVGHAGFVRSGELVESFVIEWLDQAMAVDVGRRLSPLVDIGARVDDDSDLPRTVSLLAVGETPVLTAPEYVLESWQANRSLVSGPLAPAVPAKRAGTLRAVIGRSAQGPHVIDLRQDGPHALVGGTTGSGKSELLQAWILALAAAHSPQRLTFMLIDYKGGSAFADLALLPHTVGNFTDLDPHLVRRALASLRAELRRREHHFAQHKVKDLVELERLGDPDAPPSLVIVVDEFATLVKELPEFVDGVVDVAARGRSLGVHLILATQRPAGVIKENLRANTNLRVALRTADEHDSVDVLGSPQAAFFDSSIPGRAVSKTGPGQLVPFQTGYAGGWTTDEPPPPEILLEELRFGARTVWESPEAERPATDLGPNDIQRMIGAISLASAEAQLRKPREPWLAELRGVYDLQRLPTARRDDELVFGVQDKPEEQAQPVVSFRPDEQGNLVVYGTGGAGKSTLLRTLAIAAGYTVRGGPCQLYGLDFGNRGLALLEELPHVGSVIAGTDADRIARLLTWLTRLVADRGERYSRLGADTITEYRTVAAAPDEPRILLLVDGVGAFRQAYEIGEKARLFDSFVQLATDGRAVGVHIVMSADRPASVPSALASQVQTRVVLRLADANDYQNLGMPADVVKSTSPPGRGLLEGVELQVAVLGGSSETRSQVTAVREFAEAMRRAGVVAAEPIPTMPDRIPLLELPSAVDGRPVLGLAAASLQPFPFAAEGAFLVSGPPGSGRTAAMRTLAMSLLRHLPGYQLHLLSPFRQSPLMSLGVWTTAEVGKEKVLGRIDSLLRDIQATGGSQNAVFIEGVFEFATGQGDFAMTEFVKSCLAEGAFVVGEGETSTLVSSMGLLAPLKQSRYGLAFGPDPSDGDRVFRTPFPPRLSRADFPPGRALFVHSGQTPVVGVAWVQEGA